MDKGGLAGRVRASRDSDQFDLSGYSKEQCTDFARHAFQEPFELKEMVRISFVVGGGKLCRQKYSDDLPKDFCGALNAIGFNDDKAASCELSSAGSYKFQHDTSKNLKFVHVFPRVVQPAASGDADDGEEEGASGGKSRSPADLLAESEPDEFKRLLAAHVKSYMQLRRLLDELKSRLQRLEAAEQKLIARASLDEEEQALYDSLSPDGLKEKVKLVSANLQGEIDAGRLTSEDRAQVTEQLDSKLKDLDAELKKAVSDGKAKLQQKLEEAKEKLQNTRRVVSDIKPVEPPSLRHAGEIQKLHRRLATLKKLEKDSAGHYTLDELKRLGEIPEIEEALKVYEDRSRIWFETDEEFEARKQKCLREAATPAKKAAGSGGYGGSSGGGRSDGFTTVKKKR